MNLIVFLSPDWDVSFRSALFREFAKQLATSGGKVICVNRPAFMMTDWLKQPKRFFSVFRTKSYIKENNITVIRPISVIHSIVANHLPFWGKLQRRLLTWQLNKHLHREKIDLKSTAYWINHPLQLLETKIPNDSVLIYERCDKYDAVPGITHFLTKLIQTLEQKILCRANIVVTTSQKLYDEVTHYGSKIVLLPNSADYQFFSNVRAKHIILNQVITKLPKPILGYLGTIHESTDIDIILSVAEKRPDWGFLLVGPVQQKEIARNRTYLKLTSLANVIATGWVDYADLQPYLAAFDVGIIPYKLTSHFNQYVNPNKLHEYLAMGLPIVATPIPELKDQTRWVHLASSPDEFIIGVEKALTERSERDILARMEFARSDDWEQRVGKLLPIINAAKNIS